MSQLWLLRSSPRRLFRAVVWKRRSPAVWGARSFNRSMFAKKHAIASMSTLVVSCQLSAAIDACSRWPLRCATRLFVRAQAATGNHGPQAIQLSLRCRNATSTATATTTALPRSAGRKHMGRRPRIRITTPTSAADTAVLVHNHTRLITHIRGRRVVPSTACCGVQWRKWY